MKRYILGFLLLSLACSGDKKEDSSAGMIEGYVQNTNGTAIPGVQIIIDNSIFFNSNLSTKTGADGRYKIHIPTGSWYAFAIHAPVYNGRQYRIYLHPDNAAGFGGEGATRNFVWQLTGAKPEPLSGYYGGLVTLDNFPGVHLDVTKIAFRFEPQGMLIDGSEGGVLFRSATDGYQIPDLPIGRYKVTAQYGPDKLKLRPWNTEETFKEELVFDFEPQIAGNCDNCFKIEYNQ